MEITIVENILDNLTISYGHKVTSNKIIHTTFESVIHQIKSGSWKKQIDLLQQASNKQEFKRLHLSYFNMGIFKDGKRSKLNLQSSQHLLFDYDGLTPDKLTELKTQLKADTKVFCVFTSPSGNGLKVIYKLDNPITDHQTFTNVYKYYAQEFRINLGAEPDKTSDAGRPCFMSYDPDIYVNPESETITVDVKIENVKSDVSITKRVSLLNALKTSSEGSRHTALTTILGTLIDKGFDRELALELVLRLNQTNNPPLPHNEVVSTVNSLYDSYVIADRFWSQGKEVYEIGFVKDKFFIEKIGKDKFAILMGNDKAYAKLVLEKHIKHLACVDYLGDSETQSPFYNVKLDEGVIEVNYSMLPVKIKDNQFVEEYLQNTFGEHKEFIKKYLAVYSHSNYKKLPTLILYGPRGSGKTTFAEIMMEIYPALSYQWHGNEQNFTPESEKKLLVVEENNSDKASQYKTLKKYTGQKYALVHKKFKDPYMVKNNMNIIILSNETVPLYLKKEELPVDEANNQFFVMEFKPFRGKIDNTYQQAVIDRLGYYIRTELRSLYDSMETNKYRYSIPVPITKEEKDLFNSNTTEIDNDTDVMIQNLSKRYTDLNFTYKPFIDKKLLPIGFINAWNSGNKNSIIKNLKKRRLIEADDAAKVQVAKVREYCYKMSEEFYNIIISDFEECL